MSRARVLLSLSLCVLLILVVGCGSTAPTKLEIWQQYRELKTNYQQDVYEFGADKWPDLEPVLKAQLRYDRAHMKLRTLRFKYILRNDPDRLILDRGIHEFVNFYWSKEDTRKLEAEVPRAEELRETVQRLRDKHFNHPDWPKARERFRSLPPGNSYRELSRQFQRRLNAMSSWLKRFRQSRQNTASGS